MIVTPFTTMLLLSTYDSLMPLGSITNLLCFEIQRQLATYSLRGAI